MQAMEDSIATGQCGAFRFLGFRTNPPVTYPPIHLRQQKQELRRLLDARRREAAAQNPQAGLMLRDAILKNVAFPAGCTVAVYHARGTEIDPMPLADALRNQGCPIALPVIIGKKKPLLFRTYYPGDALELGLFGIHEPLPEAATTDPDIIFVPLLGFDNHKNRLGYGGGYYDRTLTQLRQRKAIIAIGIAYSQQEVAEIPAGLHDAPLDKVATELQVF